MRVMFVLAFITFVGLNGCKTADIVNTSDTPFLAIADIGPDIRPDVLIMGRSEGVLAVRDGCVVIHRGSNYFLPLWPTGTTLVDRGGKLAVKLQDGAEAIVGKTVVLGGGRPQKPQAIIRPGCPSDQFTVSTVVME